MRDEPLRPASGSVLALRYVVERHLGTGGLGSTWLVRDEVLRRTVALKLLHQRSPEALAALRREFQLLRGVLHPNLARVHDFGALSPPGQATVAFYTSEFIDGTDLLSFCKAMPFSGCVGPVVDALRALGHLHRVGIRHGDFKPDNVLVVRSGRATLLDLSCAQSIGDPALDLISGTPDYLAPEVLAGERADARADIYACGVLLQKLGSVAGGGVPTRILRLAQRCCRKDPASRPSSVAHLLDELGVARYETRAIYCPPRKLIGRAQSWSTLQQALDGLCAGRPGPRAVCIVGPAGVGRTRLLQELKWEAQLRCDVVECSPSNADAIPGLLSRALQGTHVDSDLRSVLLAGDALSARERPVVLIADDAQALGARASAFLLALARSLPATSNALLVWSSWQKPEGDLGGMVPCELGPLSERDVLEWADGLVPPRVLPQLMLWTGGFPDALHALLSQLSAQLVSMHDLRAAAGESPLVARRAAQVAGLGEKTKWALAILAVAVEGIEEPVAQDLGVEDASLATLVELGLACRAPRGWRLARAMESQAFTAALGPDTVREAHARLADWLAHRDITDGDDAGLSQARQAAHLARAGRIEQSVAHLRANAQQVRRNPAAWKDAAAALAELSDDPHVRAAAAEIMIQAGQAAEVLRMLDSLETGALAIDTQATVALAASNALLARGEGEQAIARLDGLEWAQAGADLRLRCVAVRCRALIHLGQAGRAQELARSAYDDSLPADRRAELLDVIGVALSYLGAPSEAQTWLRKAAVLHAEAGRSDALVKTLSYRAFNAYRAGEPGAAERAYRETRDLVERHGLTDQMANAELNVGAACHQRGNWGEALSCYERGLQLASALGQSSVQVQARFNLAKLHLDIGDADRAEVFVERGEGQAHQASLTFFESAFLALRGEVAALRGAGAEAAARFGEAASGFEASGATREALEVRLQQTEALVQAGDIDAAVQRVSAIEATHGSAEEPELAAAVGSVLGQVRMAQGRSAEAAAILERALEAAKRVDRLSTRADLHRLLAEVWARQQAGSLATKERARAREIDERIGASLPEGLRDAFWQHAKRRAAPASAPRSSDASAHPLVQKLRRLLDINAKLNSSLRTRDVLGRTMDAAIELVGAERGFVILVDRPQGAPENMSVAVARNLDREQVGKSHLKFSRSIAEQCIATGEPIITVDALVDGRFAGNVSVHAMRLKSVVCVPIRSPEGTLGALYLDNRFQRGTFGPDDLELLQAFGNQAAIALTNARLHDELRKRTRDLEQERGRVQELMQSQAAEIDRLTDQVRTSQQVLEHRFDYSNIVGRSRAMQQVLATLDRVMDTDAPVLIQGESGTGKELIARALHYHGSRKSRPFVAINCAAVPGPLLESELFGHVRGAFTGADKDREGLLASARGGTVFLDEMGEMPLDMQVKLLRVLQDWEVRPLGSTKSTRVDFRLVCATNRRLADEVAAGRFRQDLFYRIDVVPLTLPPLRERREDIPVLAHHFLERHAKGLGRPAPRLERDGARALLRHSWPGNVRELENVLLNAVLLCDSGRITAQDVQIPIRPVAPSRVGSRKEFRNVEAERIRDALAANRWNVSLVARELGLSRPTLYRKMRLYGIPKD